jgi:hypothetical protein
MPQVIHVPESTGHGDVIGKLKPTPTVPEVNGVEAVLEKM